MEQTTPPPRGHTLAEILHDTNMSHLFGRMLSMGNQEELAVRLMSGKLESEDIELLEEERKRFSEKILLSEKTEKLLTEENVVEIARWDWLIKSQNIMAPKSIVTTFSPPKLIFSKYKLKKPHSKSSIIGQKKISIRRGTLR